MKQDLVNSYRKLQIIIEIKRRIEVANFYLHSAEKYTFAYAAPKLRERSQKQIDVYTKRLHSIRATSEINFLIK